MIDFVRQKLDCFCSRSEKKKSRMPCISYRAMFAESNEISNLPGCIELESISLFKYGGQIKS